jgi:hypothetical protein
VGGLLTLVPSDGGTARVVGVGALVWASDTRLLIVQNAAALHSAIRTGSTSTRRRHELERAMDAPDLVFTPAGGFHGRATRGGRLTGNAGVLVSVEGQSAVGVTDDAGEYHIDRVPVGSYTLRAQVERYRNGSVDGQAVRWGEVTEVLALDLVIAPGHAALRGTALLFGCDGHSGTTVEVEGTGLRATTAADGSWAIDGVPEGTALRQRCLRGDGEPSDLNDHALRHSRHQLSYPLDYRTEWFDDKVHGVDAVIDLVGGDTLERSSNAVVWW